MPIPILIKAIPFDKSLVTAALEAGVDGVVVEPDRVREVQGLGRIRTLTPQEMTFCSVQDKDEEESAAEALSRGETVLLQQGWEVIPVENLLAEEKGELGLEVASAREAGLAAGILEKGADFLVLLPEAAAEMSEIVRELRLSEGHLGLETARITKVQPVGLGHRVCVDTCSLLRTGQGMLAGNSSAFTFLVHAETEENPYVASRPFRINAGAVHSYCVLPGDQTRYLEELRSGDEALVVDAQGASTLTTVGRVKIEVRPLLLIAAENESGTGEVFVQNAETIRLVTPEGRPVSVVSLSEGDQVLCRTEQGGRHFGMRITENIEER
ncbi:MAG: 3-dehydroquinate synthase II family protein [Desulfohalobiaceae bacterium]|nr:3-dehydroquinate synthase II family protein [Desulfohalobiaceae bacterium]